MQLALTAAYPINLQLLVRDCVWLVDMVSLVNRRQIAVDLAQPVRGHPCARLLTIIAVRFAGYVCPEGSTNSTANNCQIVRSCRLSMLSLTLFL